MTTADQGPCPFDAPRPASNEHWDFIGALCVSSLYLSKNQTYRGYSLLVFDPRHAERLDELSSTESSAFALDLSTANCAIQLAVHPDHMNVAQLGNVIRHLHWHIVPRYRSDPRWGGPVWTTTPAEMQMTELPASEQRGLVEQIRGAFGSVPPDTPDPIDRAIRNLWSRRKFRHGHEYIVVEFLLRTEDWRPLRAVWWHGKDVCIIGADASGNFLLRHCDGTVRYWSHRLQADAIIAPSVRAFVAGLE